MTQPSEDRPHGSYARHKLGSRFDESDKGCRCDECRSAGSEYMRQRARRTAPPYVAAAAARSHLLWLRSCGVGLKQVSKRSGVSNGCLSRIIYGDYRRGTPPSRRIRAETERRILAVGAKDRSQGSRSPRGPVDADVAELVSMGWTKGAIALAIGKQTKALQLGKTVSRRNADAIHALVVAERARVVAEDEDRPPTGRVSDLPCPPKYQDRPWMAQAACRFASIPTRIFFPTRGDLETLAAAKRVCGSCPVTTECLAYALDDGRSPGIWGGTSGSERRALRREQSQAAS